jgi:uncharacterized protein (DUF885 family)
MTRFWLPFAVCASLCFAGCNKSQPPVAAAAPPGVGDQLKDLVERYWAERIPVDAVIAPQGLADARSVERRYLDELLALPTQGMDAEARLTREIFRRQRESNLEGFTYPSELIPLNPFSGPSARLASAAADTARHPLATSADYEAWLKREETHVAWLQQAVLNLKDGARRGYLAPRALVERCIVLFGRLGEDNSSNVFYMPIRTMPASIKGADRTRLSAALNAASSHDLMPAFRALHDYLQREYLPLARTGLGITDLPLGPSWYAYRVRRVAGESLTAEQINKYGRAEAERAHARLLALQPVPPAAASGMPPAPATRIEAYQELAAKIHADLDKVVAQQPKSGFELRPTEYLREPGAPLLYLPRDADEHRPAVLYVLPYRSANTVSVGGFLMQGEPGRHLQTALQQENAALPRFRRYGDDAAFAAGWGLYAMGLADEVGAPNDEAAKIDALQAQLHCDVALVVDTGLHALGWTRTQALDYLRSQGVVDDAEGQAMIDSYAAMPADAMACKLGEIRFQTLRLRAQQTLGARFDLRAFDAAILAGGAMPMDILESRMKAWIETSP